MSSGGAVARYYDRNTLRFLLVGGGGSSYAIHRQLWGPGVTSAHEASNYINRQIGDELLRLELARPFTLVDMGCGIGGTLFHLAEMFTDGRFVGVTISRRQHDIARRLAARKGLGGRCWFVQGDFQHVDLANTANAIVAIESFVHSESPDRFFAAASAHLCEGGYVIIADDFIVPDGRRFPDRATQHIAVLRDGWHLPSLCTIEECFESASAAGLSVLRDLDLTGLIRVGRPRDRAIAWLSPLFRGLGLIDVPFFGNMIGGNALQVGLRDGFLQYHLLVLQKPFRQ